MAASCDPNQLLLALWFGLAQYQRDTTVRIDVRLFVPVFAEEQVPSVIWETHGTSFDKVEGYPIHFLFGISDLCTAVRMAEHAWNARQGFHLAI